MLLHIPHSSTTFPTTASVEVPEAELNLHTDWFTDELFDGHVKFVYPFSRFYCDVERLPNDPLEAVGRGIAYTKLSDGTEYRSISEAQAEEFAEMHREWHLHMKREAEKQSSMLDSVIVVDCHSYSAAQVNMDEADLADVCIGFNYDHSQLPMSVIAGLSEVFRDAGYSVAFNVPYGGAVKVSEVSNVFSVMIEVNKRTYLASDFSKSDGFEKMKATIAVALKYLSDFEVGVIRDA